MVSADWLGLLLALVVLAGGQAALAQTDTFPLTNALQIRALSPELAQNALPVRLRGVVTYYDVPLYNLFLQDATAGIFVLPDPGANTPAMAGQEVEIEGVTGKGDYAPIIKANSIRVIGPGKLPAPPSVSLDEMAAGFEDIQWIEVRGVVRAAAMADGRQYLTLFMNGQRLTVSIKDIKPSERAQLLDASVRLRGVCYSRFNQRRQLRAPWLAVSSFADIVIERRSSGEPETVSLASLSQFDSRAYYGRRVKVSGVVTLQKTDGSFFIQSGNVGLCVRATQPGQLKEGELVSVTGYSAPGLYTPVLEDAMVQPLGQTNLPLALPVDLATLLHSPEDFEGMLVRVEANLINRIDDPMRQSLVLQSSNSIFTAQLENANADSWFKSLNNGSRLILSGVFDAQPPAKWIPHLAPSREKNVPGLAYAPPEAMQILLRSPADIFVLEQPPWWTLARLLWTLAMLSFVLVAAAMWVVVLNRRVRRQMHIIEQKVKREGVLEERDRIAREFHDTLEQEIAAITIQLDAVEAQFVESPQTARRLLGLARNMARRSLAEARRSVRDLRSHLLENNDLPTALKEMAAPFAQSSGVEIAVQSTGFHSKLPALAEHNLLRVAQEAIVNAIKHARPKKIVVALSYAAGQLQLTIRDDGIGFEPQSVGSASGGHFGLLDMHERAEKIGGRFALNSRPGNGTEIVIIIAGPAAPRESNALNLNSH